MLKRIHINQHVIRANRKNKKQDPIIAVKTYKGNTYGKEVVIFDNDGKECARIVYRPQSPLSCGAEVWVETRNEVRVE